MLLFMSNVMFSQQQQQQEDEENATVPLQVMCRMATCL